MKILFVRLSALGDILHMLWVLPQLRADFKEAKLSLLVDERFAGLFEEKNLFDEVLVIRRKHWLKDVQNLAKTHKFDYALDFQSRLKSAICAKLLAKKSFGYFYKGCKNFMASYLYDYRCDCEYKLNVYERSCRLYLSFAKAIKGTYSDELIKLNDVFGGPMLYKSGFTLLHNGASKLQKALSIEQIISLLKYLDSTIYLAWGNETELERAQVIAKVYDEVLDLSSKQASGDFLAKTLSVASVKIVILPKLSLAQLIELSRCASLIIGHDSGPLHLGSLCGVSTLCFIKNLAHKPAKRFMAPSSKANYVLFEDFDKTDFKSLFEEILN